MDAKAAFELLKATYADWSEDKASRLGAALAYYTVFAMGPLLVVIISLAGLIFGHEAAQAQVMTAIQEMIGPQGTDAIQEMILHASRPGTGLTATLVSMVMLVAGAFGVVGQLKDALNTIWEVQPVAKKGIWAMVRERMFTFGTFLGFLFLMLVSMLLTAGISAMQGYVTATLPGNDAVWQVINTIVAFGITTLLFATMFKYLPDAKIAWRDVWIGAVVTALLFTVGKFAIGLYLGNSNLASGYGAASSLVVVMIWTYYSAQILFFGAELTQVYANRYGSRIVPEEHAVPLTAEARAQQGMKGEPRVTWLPEEGAARKEETHE